MKRNYIAYILEDEMQNKRSPGFLFALAICLIITGCSGGSPLGPTPRTGLVDVTPPWLNVPMGNMAIEGDVLYLCENPFGLHIFDISDELNPSWRNVVEIGHPGWISGFIVQDGFAYILSYKELTIVDVSPISSAHLVSTSELVGDPHDIAVYKGYAYLACQNDDLLLTIDIREPAAPIMIQSLDIPPYPRSVAVKGNYAYVTDNEQGIQVVDISDPAQASVVHSVETDVVPRNITFRGEYALIACYSGQLKVLDISEPESAHIVTTFEFPRSPEEIYFKDEYAFVFTHDDSGGCIPMCYYGLQISKINLPDSLEIVHEFELPSSLRGMGMGKNYGYFTDGSSGLNILDISLPESTSVVKTLYEPRFIDDIAADNGYVYLLDYYGGLQIIDATIPSSTHTVSSVEVKNADSIAVENGYAYVVEHSGLKIIDIDPPETAGIVREIELSPRLLGIAVDAGYAYITNSKDNLFIVDVTTAETAYLVKIIDLQSRWPEKLAVENGYAYVAGMDDFIIADVDPPNSGYVIMTIDTAGTPEKIALDNGFAYIANNDGGLKIVDIDPPENAFISNTVYLPGHTRDVCVQDGYAFMVNTTGLFVIDVGIPGGEAIATTFDTVGWPEMAAIWGEYLYYTGSRDGFHIVELNEYGGSGY